jgi:2-polyprenyl-3-methyl-5-hydroxy-6-metoxy-1,4-benzoquinol methylase
MDNYGSEMAKLYDTIHGDKDYRIETKFIQDTYFKYADIKLTAIVDIGCGTGRHSIEMAKLGYQVTGVDPSSDMIQIAKENYSTIGNCEFIDGYSSTIAGEYQLAVSMFNVINHIMSVNELVDFFKSAKKLLVNGGIFIFDCFNGTAALIDPPRNREIKKMIPNSGEMLISTTCESSMMESTVVMHNTIKYMDEVYSYDLSHRLWSPMIITELLSNVGLKFIKATKAYHLDSDASIDDYKIVFICKSI